MTTSRRWRIERRDGRWMECHVACVRHPEYGIVFETQARFDGSVFYERRHPTQHEAERDAEDRLRDAVEYGWIRSESRVAAAAAAAAAAN